MFSPVLSIHNNSRWDPLTWPFKTTCSEAGHRFKFSLGSFKLNQSDELSLNKKLTSHLLKGKLLQLWGGSTWLTPGYGHLSLKPPLCWEWLNHTKNDQPGNYETRLGAL